MYNIVFFWWDPASRGLQRRVPVIICVLIPVGFLGFRRYPTWDLGGFPLDPMGCRGIPWEFPREPAEKSNNVIVCSLRLTKIVSLKKGPGSHNRQRENSPQSDRPREHRRPPCNAQLPLSDITHINIKVRTHHHTIASSQDRLCKVQQEYCLHPWRIYRATYTP